MQTTFKTKKGKEFAPKTFAVIYYKNGKTKKSANYDDANDALYDFPGSIKAEIYKNGTTNLSSEKIDTAIIKKDFMNNFKDHAI